jgi:outer membrane protein TolC
VSVARVVQVVLATCLLVQHGWAQEMPAGPLGPDEVLRSVSTSLPLLERARRDVERARGEALETQGAFDLKVKSEALAVRGAYDSDRVKTVLEQPLAALGMTPFAGYRAGRGTFAPYDGKAQTLSDGEFSAGLTLPLLRNRATDERRTARETAALGVDVATQGLDKARLGYFKDALAEYWDWVAAGAQERIARSLVDLAETRDTQLADAVALGQVAAVERTDNRRAILQRRSALVAARRAREQQAIDLSLFLRDGHGRPVRPSLERLPEAPGAGGPAAEPDDARLIERALVRRPELAALRLKRRQESVALELARNSLLPELDVFSLASRDVGAGAPARAGSSFEAGVTFTLPLQRRKAGGKTLQAEAKLAAIDQEILWTEDRVRADVQDALSAVQAARGVLEVLAEEVTVARELEGLERDRFALGDSTQFLVNLRELATADAAMREVRARADYQKALAALQAATGDLLDRVP